VDCYIDFTALVVIDPKQLLISNTLFLATANLVLVANQTSEIHDVAIVNNRWSSESKYSNATIIAQGDFTKVLNVVIENNIADIKWDVKSTRATKTMPVNQSQSTLTFDYSDTLLFVQAPIQSARCDLETSAGQPVVALSTSIVDANRPMELVVNMAASTQGRVTCTVDQSQRIHAGH
jgi:hypothetical protein